MLKIHYIFGGKDGTPDLNPALLVGDVAAFQANATVQSLKAGRLAKIGTNGYVALAVDGDAFAGFIINDAAGYSFENVPALASGKLPILFGGGVVDTDQVKEGTVVAGDVLYIGAGGDAGLLTKVAPTVDSIPVAVARTANSAGDKTLTVQF